MNTRQTKNKGFSLIEIVIYVAILGITGTILSGILISATKIKSQQTASIEVLGCEENQRQRRQNPSYILSG